MKTQATKIDHCTWHYRGFTIERNFTSEHGTWATCKTQRGYAVTPSSRNSGSGIQGDWEPSLSEACESIDRLHEKYAAGTLSRQGREIVEAAIRQAAFRGESVDKPATTTLIRLPVTFFIDHEERSLPTPTVVRETKSHFFVASGDPALGELLSDAEHYAHPYGPDADGLSGLKASAKATVRAIRDAIGWDDAEPAILRLKKAP